MAAADALPAAGLFVSPIIENVMERGMLLLSKRYNLNKKTRKSVNKLCVSLDLLKGVLEAVEEKQYRLSEARARLAELKHILYEAEDLLDLCAVHLAFNQKQRKEDKYPPIFPDPYPQMMKINEKLDGILESWQKLDGILESWQKFDVILESEPRLSASTAAASTTQIVGPTFKLGEVRETRPLQVKESAVIGRRSETGNILQMLLPEAASNDSFEKRFGVIPIVGMPGVGKTTLAMHVLSTEDVKNFFKLRMWVYVGSSTELDLKQILIDILKSIDGCHGICDGSFSLEFLQCIVRKELEKRQPFLLVLVDAWDSDRRTWEEALNPFKACAGAENRIIVTTTDNEVACSIPDSFSIVSLGLLDDEDMWSILKRNAFLDEKDSGHCAELEPRGRQIVKRLKGLPLAAETIGNLLNGKNEEFWDSILEKLKKIGSNRLDKNMIPPILMLSYNYLPTHMKACFSYLSLFPKGYRFGIDGPYSKHDIARQWMAHEFFPSVNGTQSEDVRSCRGFVELFNKSLLLQVAKKDTLENTCFSIHDFVHDLAEYISKEEIVRLGDDSIAHLPEHIRHVSVFLEQSKSEIPWKLEEHETLRSLLFVAWSNIHVAKYSISILDNWFKNLRYLRVFVLCNDYISSLPDSIGNLRLLRLLDLRLKNLRKLPETISELCNLQVLKLCGCESLSSVPNSITNLVILRYLDVDSNLLGIIHSIRRNFTGLLQLNEVCMGSEEGFKLRELGKEEVQALCPADQYEEMQPGVLEGLWSSEQQKEMQSGVPEGLWSTEQHEDIQSGDLEGLWPSEQHEEIQSGLLELYSSETEEEVQSGDPEGIYWSDPYEEIQSGPLERCSSEQEEEVQSGDPEGLSSSESHKEIQSGNTNMDDERTVYSSSYISFHNPDDDGPGKGENTIQSRRESLNNSNRNKNRGRIPWIRGIRLNFGLTRLKREKSYGKTSKDEFLKILMGKPLRQFSYRELDLATNGFANSIGFGGSSTVYKGLLKCSSSWGMKGGMDVVAVKVFRSDDSSVDNYMREITVISELRHRNVVRLLGWSYKDKHRFLKRKRKKDAFMALVFEYVPNRSLYVHLHESGGPILRWELRYWKIALGVASALLYIHEGLDRCVIHRDVKTSNVLLDSDFNPKLGSFEIAEIVDLTDDPHESIQIVGTFGYADPHYLATGCCSSKSDIYGFGVVALEIATGRRPFREEAHLRLPELVNDLHKKGDILEAADPILGNAFDRQEMEQLLLLGLLCTNIDPNRRPSASLILRYLNFQEQMPLNLN